MADVGSDPILAIATHSERPDLGLRGGLKAALKGLADGISRCGRGIPRRIEARTPVAFCCPVNSLPQCRATGRLPEFSPIAD